MKIRGSMTDTNVPKPPTKDLLPIGTKLSGYIDVFTQEGVGSGCWNCIHFDRHEANPDRPGTVYPEHCDHDVVRADAEVEHFEDKPLVKPGGCCTFIRRDIDNA